MKPEVLINVNCEHAEGPMWHPTEHCLYWVDILAKQVHRFDPKLVAHQVFKFDKMPGAVVPMESHFLVLISFEDGIATFNTHTEELEYLVQYHQNEPNMRANDGKCDPEGRFWVGTMSKTAEADAGNLYVLNADGSFEVKIANTTIANGLAWDKESTKMYFIDSVLDGVQSFHFDGKTGNISLDKTVIHQSTMRYFDGMTIDTEGMLWVAHFGDSCIRRWNPETGEVLLKVDFPCPQITSMTFGGADYKTLYVTSSQENMSASDRAKYPLSGAIFYIETEFTGLKTNVFIKN